MQDCHTAEHRDHRTSNVKGLKRVYGFTSVGKQFFVTSWLARLGEQNLAVCCGAYRVESSFDTSFILSELEISDEAINPYEVPSSMFESRNCGVEKDASQAVGFTGL